MLSTRSLRRSIRLAMVMLPLTAWAVAARPVTPWEPARDDAPWFGTWHLDVERSAYPGPAPYRRGTCVIEPWNDGLTSICDLVRVRGGVTHLEWTGRFDERDYPVHGVEEYVTYAYTLRDERGYDVIVKLDGKEAARSRVTVSDDRQTMTVVTNDGRSVTTSVYRRR
jgi:hypothetical protein